MRRLERSARLQNHTRRAHARVLSCIVRNHSELTLLPAVQNAARIFRAAIVVLFVALDVFTIPRRLRTWWGWGATACRLRTRRTALVRVLFAIRVTDDRLIHSGAIARASHLLVLAAPRLLVIGPHFPCEAVVLRAVWRALPQARALGARLRCFAVAIVAAVVPLGACCWARALLDSARILQAIRAVAFIAWQPLATGRGLLAPHHGTLHALFDAAWVQ
jgi:hypothetical protein